LLLSVYFTNDEKEENQKQQVVLKEMLEEQGLTLKKIEEILSIEEMIHEEKLRKLPSNLYVVKENYQIYYRTKTLDVDSANTQETIKEENPENIRTILERLWQRTVTNTLAIEKICLLANCDSQAVDFSEKNVEENTEKLKIKLYQKYIQSFYNNLSKETIDFMDFTVRIYSILLEQMQEEKLNKDYVKTEDDIDTLALCIANYYYHSEVSKFFQANGITLQKILVLLNIEISREKIEEYPVNPKILRNRFHRFVKDGVNKDKSSEKIRINDVIENLCNREFNRSMIMENIFEELKNKESESLSSDFLDLLKKRLEREEEIRVMNLRQKFFRDMPTETIELLETTSKIDTFLRKKGKNWYNKDLEVISLLLAIISLENQIAKFFLDEGFTKDKIATFFNMDMNQLLKEEVDIDRLVEKYGVFIFGGKNQGIKRTDLTVERVAQNLWNKDLNNSVELSKLLSTLKRTYQDYEDLDKTYQEYKMKKQLEEEENNLLSQYYISCRNYMLTATRLHERIRNAMKENTHYMRNLETEDDITELSLVLTVFLTTNKAKEFFEKNHLTLKSILDYCGLDYSITENLSDDYDKTTLLTNCKRYFEIIETHKPFLSVDDLIKQIFVEGINKSLILEELSSHFGTNYEILKEEVETGKDYIVVLTPEKRVEILSKLEPEKLDPTNYVSLLRFGNRLAEHSSYIHDEYATLRLNDKHDEAIKMIHQVTEKVYQKEMQEEKPRGFFARIFKKQKTQLEVPSIDYEGIKELRNTIQEDIEILSKELASYGSIQKCIEIYRQKNNQQQTIAEGVLMQLEEKLRYLNPENNTDYDEFLRISSNLEVLRNKINRFQTSNLLMKQTLAQVAQAITTHYLTISALELACHDLLPLILSELTIAKGKETEGEALALSKNVIDLFQSLLVRNVDLTRENIKKLGQSNIGELVLNSINQNVKTYIDEVTIAPSIVSQGKSLEQNFDEGQSIALTFGTQETGKKPYKKKI